MPALVVVQNNPAVDALTAPVSRRARERGEPLVDLNLDGGLDFGNLGIDYAEPDPLLLHGSVGFLRLAMRHEPLAARLAWSGTAFLASRWAEAFGAAYLGHGGGPMAAADVAARLDRGERLAVRPEIGLKGFAGGVYDAASWRAAGIDPSTACYAMGPSELLSEHRVWFVDGVPVAGSRYRADGRASKDGVGVPEAMERAAEMVGAALPLPDVVVDVARTPQGWRIIELNCVHTAGWHAVDPADVVDALLDRKAHLVRPGAGF